MGKKDKATSSEGSVIRQDNFAGVDNVTHEERLTSADFRDAVNIDLTKDGMIEGRSGYESVHSGEGIRSLWGDGDSVYFGEGSDLKKMDAETLDIETQLAGIHPVNPLGFERIDQNIYMTDGLRNMVILESGDTKINGVEEPTIAAAFPDSGSMHSGTFQVCATAVRADGEESGTSDIVTVEVTQGGIQLTGIVPPADPLVTSLNIYVSTVDGELLYRVANIPHMSTSYTITSQNNGPELRTFNLCRLPPGRDLFEHGGRLYVVAGKILYWSEPLRYGLCNVAMNYIPFEGQIGAAGSVDGGVFVAVNGGKTYFLAGNDPDAFVRREVFQYGAPIGKPLVMDAETFGFEFTGRVLVWMSDDGICAGTPDGTAFNMTESRVAMRRMESTALLHRGDAGKSLIVASSRVNDGANRLKIGDTMGIEVRRNGVIIG